MNISQIKYLDFNKVVCHIIFILGKKNFKNFHNVTDDIFVINSQMFGTLDERRQITALVKQS